MTLRWLVTLEDLGETCGILREAWGVKHDALEEEVGEGEGLHRLDDEVGSTRWATGITSTLAMITYIDSY